MIVGVMKTTVYVGDMNFTNKKLALDFIINSELSYLGSEYVDVSDFSSSTVDSWTEFRFCTEADALLFSLRWA